MALVKPFRRNRIEPKTTSSNRDQSWDLIFLPGIDSDPDFEQTKNVGITPIGTQITRPRPTLIDQIRQAEEQE